MPQRTGVHRKIVTADSAQAVTDLVVVVKLFGWELQAATKDIDQTGARRYRLQFER